MIGLTPEAIRRLTAESMACPCGRRMLITPSGMLVCEDGCGRLVGPPPKFSPATMRRGWPDRVIEPAIERKPDFKKNKP